MSELIKKVKNNFPVLGVFIVQMLTIRLLALVLLLRQFSFRNNNSLINDRRGLKRAIFLIIVFFSLFVGGLQARGDSLAAIQIRVFTNYKMSTSGAQVKIVHEKTKKQFRAIYNDQTKIYSFDSIPFGQVVVKISLKGYENQERIMWVKESTYNCSFYMGKKGASYTYRDGAKYPFVSNKYEIAVRIKTGFQDSLTLLAKQLKLEIRKSNAEISEVWILRKSNGFHPDSSSELEILRNTSYVYSAGPVYSESGVEEGYFNNRITVAFVQNTPYDTILDICKRYNLKLGERTGTATYFVLAPAKVGTGINAIMKQLMTLESVLYVNPDIQPLKYNPKN